MHDSSHSPERQQLIAWLTDAHAMELALAKVLENHARDAERHPDIRARDEQHLAETRLHASQVERCLELLGAEAPSKMKNMMGTAMGKMQGAMSGPFGDEIMKNFISDYAAEHMEIACYRALIIAADELGEHEVSRLCSQILAEEEQMAHWLEQHLPEITRLSLHQAPAAH
jgi:ferritin-like metal-binding protein YciE